MYIIHYSFLLIRIYDFLTYSLNTFGKKRMGYSPTLSNCPRTAAVARPFLRFFSVLSLETSLESIILRSPYMPPPTPSMEACAFM